MLSKSSSQILSPSVHPLSLSPGQQEAPAKYWSAWTGTGAAGGLSHCQMLCFCFLWAYVRVVQLSVSLLEGFKKLQMQMFDQPADTTRNNEREWHLKKTKEMNQSKRKILMSNLQDWNKWQRWCYHFKSVVQLWDSPEMEWRSDCRDGHCSMPAAVLREQYLVRMCVCARGIFREARCRHPFGNAGRGGNRGMLWFHVSIR